MNKKELLRLASLVGTDSEFATANFINAVDQWTEAENKIDENTSDGYHTFKELYAHRIALFIALAKSHSDISWKAPKHADGSIIEGWFIAGMNLPTGAITYHLPDSEWDRLDMVEALSKAPEWDGHTSDDVVQRLNEWVEMYE